MAANVNYPTSTQLSAKVRMFSASVYPPSSQRRTEIANGITQRNLTKDIMSHEGFRENNLCCMEKVAGGGGLTVANALATRYLAQTFYLFYLLIYFTFLPLLLVTQQNNHDNHFSQYRAALVGTFTVATH